MPIKGNRNKKDLQLTLALSLAIFAWLSCVIRANSS